MIKILSLFDWMSCGQIAINRLWIKEYEYYASEIDKFAMQVAKENYPNTHFVGDVTKIDWKLYENIDLLIWWSPCQWFSFAWKQMNFEDERSKLFFEYVRILNEAKPRYFLLENVKMKKEYQNIITEHLFWVEPIEINSSLLTAQNRKRLYWVWERQKDGAYKKVEINQPEDRWILLKDILEEVVDDKYSLSETQWNKLKNYESNSKLSPLRWKSSCLTTCQWWHRQPKIWYAPWSREFETTWWQEWKSPTLCARDYKDPKIVAMQTWNSKNFWNSWWNEKAYTIKTTSWHWVIDLENVIVRKLTPTECERLQWVDDNYTGCVSNSQRYKMLWNWWTVPVIEYIFSKLKI